MKLCDDEHDEVCYEDRECPACAMKYERDKETQRADDAEQAVDRAERALRKLEAENERL